MGAQEWTSQGRSSRNRCLDANQATQVDKNFSDVKKMPDLVYDH
jgi:hypothetical protein